MMYKQEWEEQLSMLTGAKVEFMMKVLHELRIKG